jgi:hypothetical protein
MIHRSRILQPQRTRHVSAISLLMCDCKT